VLDTWRVEPGVGQRRGELGAVEPVVAVEVLVVEGTVLLLEVDDRQRPGYR